MKTVLTIAGSDSSGGAGIQADLKTMTELGTFGMSAITAITAQNTCGVNAVLALPCDMISAQIDAVCDDIFPDAVKIGMLANSQIVECVAASIKKNAMKNIVLDPVMVSTSVHRLLDDDASDALINVLMPLADIITPNIPEAECLAGMKIASKADMIKAAGIIAGSFDGAVLIKGGHLANTGANCIEDSTNVAADLLYHGGQTQWFEAEFVDNPNTHGTGCTLSSAIASELAKGADMPEAVRKAKAYLTGAIKAGLNLGKGRGPLNHAWQNTISDC